MINDKLKRRLSGRVTSSSMIKTVTVLIERRIKHPLYGKYIIHSKKYHAHVENSNPNVGDIVTIEECRPLSKTKNWKVIESSS